MKLYINAFLRQNDRYVPLKSAPLKYKKNFPEIFCPDFAGGNTNVDSLRSCLCFRVFRLNFASNFFDLLLVRFHQAEIIIAKHAMRVRNNEAWVGVEPACVGVTCVGGS